MGTCSLLFFFLLLLLLLLLLMVVVPGYGVQFSASDYASWKATVLTFRGSTINSTRGILELNPYQTYTIGRALFRSAVQFRQNITDSSTGGTITLLASFNTSFVFSMSTEYSKGAYGDGMAFLICPNPYRGDDLQVSSGGYLGMFNWTTNGKARNKVVAIEFDTYKNTLFSDPNGNHVGVDVNSVQSVITNDLKSVGIDLTAGAQISCWIDYDGISKQLWVFLSYSTIKPSTPIISLSLDISAYINNNMYVGFTSATGTKAELHTVHSWSFSSNLVMPSPPPPPPLVPPPPSPPSATSSPSTPAAAASSSSSAVKQRNGVAAGCALTVIVIVLGLFLCVFITRRRWAKQSKDSLSIFLPIACWMYWKEATEPCTRQSCRCLRLAVPSVELIAWLWRSKFAKGYHQHRYFLFGRCRSNAEQDAGKVQELVDTNTRKYPYRAELAWWDDLQSGEPSHEVSVQTSPRDHEDPVSKSTQMEECPYDALKLPSEQKQRLKLHDSVARAKGDMPLPRHSVVPKNDETILIVEGPAGSFSRGVTSKLKHSVRPKPSQHSRIMQKIPAAFVEQLADKDSPRDHILVAHEASKVDSNYPSQQVDQYHADATNSGTISREEAAKIFLLGRRPSVLLPQHELEDAKRASSLILRDSDSVAELSKEGCMASGASYLLAHQLDEEYMAARRAYFLLPHQLGEECMAARRASFLIPNELDEDTMVERRASFLISHDSEEPEERSMTAGHIQVGKAAELSKMGKLIPRELDEDTMRARRASFLIPHDSEEPEERASQVQVGKPSELPKIGKLNLVKHAKVVRDKDPVTEAHTDEPQHVYSQILKGESSAVSEQAESSHSSMDQPNNVQNIKVGRGGHVIHSWLFNADPTSESPPGIPKLPKLPGQPNTARFQKSDDQPNSKVQETEGGGHSAVLMMTEPELQVDSERRPDEPDHTTHRNVEHMSMRQAETMLYIRRQSFLIDQVSESGTSQDALSSLVEVSKAPTHISREAAGSSLKVDSSVSAVHKPKPEAKRDLLMPSITAAQAKASHTKRRDASPAHHPKKAEDAGKSHVLHSFLFVIDPPELQAPATTPIPSTSDTIASTSAEAGLFTPLEQSGEKATDIKAKGPHHG